MNASSMHCACQLEIVKPGAVGGVSGHDLGASLAGHLHGAQQATPQGHSLKPRPPPLGRHVPLPRMPPDAICIEGRPKSPVDLTKLPPWQLYEALLKAPLLPDQPLASRDKVRVHPTNNAFTLNVRESVWAQAYLRITSLQIGVWIIELHVYTPPPYNAFRGIMFNAYDHFTEAKIFKILQESNSTMPVMGGRRMGWTNHVLVTKEIACHDGSSIKASTFSSTTFTQE
ncbi:hypothetical protein HPB51_012916 [Rhipicephalus microplus]|uniref:Uncharacterized protein n=1 Tax=Rhipicephalus microplus TaxID=6941 RepID=A0A9J6ESQ4_RHIMP|nr:hypothetical protein HPB51_012916 [Rhipicephalus microplus]